MVPVANFLVYHRAAVVGVLVSRERSRAAAATSRSASSARATRSRDCCRCCGSTSRTTPFVRGRGSSPGWRSSSSIPGCKHPETGYMMVLNAHLPHQYRGIAIAGFLAAFMSTIATQLNWGASYLVADFYRRFLRRRRLRAALRAGLALVHGAAGDRVGVGVGATGIDRLAAGKWCCRSARARARCTSCAGTGGGSMPGAKSRPWRARCWSPWFSSAGSHSAATVAGLRQERADDHDRHHSRLARW